MGLEPGTSRSSARHANLCAIKTRYLDGAENRYVGRVNTPARVGVAKLQKIKRIFSDCTQFEHRESSEAIEAKLVGIREQKWELCGRGLDKP